MRENNLKSRLSVNLIIDNGRPADGTVDRACKCVHTGAENQWEAYRQPPEAGLIRQRGRKAEAGVRRESEGFAPSDI